MYFCELVILINLTLKQIKENRRADKITSGPQSHILEGVAWDEAKKLQDANMSATGDQVS